MALAVAIPNSLAVRYKHMQNTASDPRLDPPLAGAADMSQVSRTWFLRARRRDLIYLSRHGPDCPALRAGRRSEYRLVGPRRSSRLRLGDRAARDCLRTAVWSPLPYSAATIGKAGTGDLRPGPRCNSCVAPSVCAAIAVTYAFFLITLHWSRCVYPISSSRCHLFRTDGAALTGRTPAALRLVPDGGRVHPAGRVVAITFFPRGSAADPGLAARGLSRQRRRLHRLVRAVPRDRSRYPGLDRVVGPPVKD